MKAKRFLALLLSLLMIVSVLPTYALADNSGISDRNDVLSDSVGSVVTVTNEDDFIAAISGEAETIILGSDLALDTDTYYSSLRIPIKRSLTIDGGEDKHTVKVSQRGFGVGMDATAN